MNELKILLVEPFYESDYLPLGLMKIARYWKNIGAEVRYKKGEAGFDFVFKPDMIYITSLFTWDYKIVVQTVHSYLRTYPEAQVFLGGICATLLKEDFEKEFVDFKNFKLHTGLEKNFEKYLPDYSLFPKTDYFIGFTSRGCPRRCGFCMVHKHEPEYEEYSNWKELVIDYDLMYFKKRLILWDNNFLASTPEHFDRVCQELSAFGKRFKIDFNQAIDCRLFTEEKAKGLAKVNLEFLRFAFDGMQEDKFFQNAMKLARDNGIECEARIYVLYGFADTPEDFYYRLLEIAKLNCVAFPMKYQPLNSKEKSNFIGKNWSEKTLLGFKRLSHNHYPHGVIITGVYSTMNENTLFTIDYFYKVFGKTPEEFKNKIENYKGSKIISKDRNNFNLNSFFGGEENAKPI